MFQIVPGIYDALSKTFCTVVSLVLIRLYSVCVIKVTPFQRQNFLVFVENGTFVELFGWLRANVVQGVTGQDSFFHTRIYPNFCAEGKARAVRSHRQRGLPSACHSFKFSVTSQMLPLIDVSVSTRGACMEVAIALGVGILEITTRPFETGC
jgi:hypothetical protein